MVWSYGTAVQELWCAPCGAWAANGISNRILLYLDDMLPGLLGVDDVTDAKLYEAHQYLKESDQVYHERGASKGWTCCLLTSRLLSVHRLYRQTL